MGDAGFIVKLRARTPRTRHIHRGAQTVQEQQAWLDAYMTRKGDYYFIVYRVADAASEGTIGIYDVNEQAGTAEWGRWVLRDTSLAAIEAVLLMYRVAFAELGLNRVYSRTLADNQKTVSFHDSCGIPRTGNPISLVVDDIVRPAVEHQLTRNQWPEVEARLEPMARRIGRRLSPVP